MTRGLPANSMTIVTVAASDDAGNRQNHLQRHCIESFPPTFASKAFRKLSTEDLVAYAEDGRAAVSEGLGYEAIRDLLQRKHRSHGD